MGDPSVFKMSFASDAYFYKGLEARATGQAAPRFGARGPPSASTPASSTCRTPAAAAIKREHCEAALARAVHPALLRGMPRRATTTTSHHRPPPQTFNYEIETCPELGVVVRRRPRARLGEVQGSPSTRASRRGATSGSR